MFLPSTLNYFLIIIFATNFTNFFSNFNVQTAFNLTLNTFLDKHLYVVNNYSYFNFTIRNNNILPFFKVNTMGGTITMISNMKLLILEKAAKSNPLRKIRVKILN